MKRGISGFLLAVVVSAILVVSCNKDENSNNSEAKGSVELAVSLNTINNALKSANADTLTGISSVVVTIEDANGKVIKNSEKIELYNMNGSYISKPLSLVKGSYKLTQFIVLDWKSNILYASPLAGSAKAYLVSKPLSIAFTVQENVVTKLTPEVVSTIDSTPEAFGYATFNFDIAKTFDFLLGVFVYNETSKNYELTTASLSVTSGTTSVYTGQLSAKGSSSSVAKYDSVGVTNKITLPERYNTYTLTITKLPYKTYTYSFSKDELKQYYRSTDKGPLVVILEKSALMDGLVAYYKFNGDVKDYSGYGNNGTYYGRGVYSTGRKSDVNGAVDFNGSSDYVVVKNSTALNPDQLTICVWYYPISFYGNGANSLVTKMAHIADPINYQYHLNVLSDSYGGNPNDPHMRAFGFRITTTEGDFPITTTGTGDFSYKYYQYQLYQWNFVVGTFNGDSLKLYVNGDLKAWRSVKGTIVKSAHDVYMGNTEGYSRPINDYTGGKVDEVIIYNRALTQKEISALYQQ